MAKTCSEASCDRRARGRGLCGTHYAYRNRHGTLPPLIRRKGCTVDACEREHEARGLCNLHYARVRTTGSVDQPLATGPDAARFWAKVDRSGGPNACWPWLAGISSNTGYGNIWWFGRTKSAHRVAYELSFGQISPNLTLDHLCRVRHCVNPGHLEPVVFRINNARGTSPSALNAAKTHCVNGHEFTVDNTYIPPTRGKRDCRRCRAAASRRARRSS